MDKDAEPDLVRQDDLSDDAPDDTVADTGPDAGPETGIDDDAAPPNGSETGPRVVTSAEHGYLLDEQVGYLLRRAYQRNSLIFSDLIPGGLTTTQFSVMFRLGEDGPMSQNMLGRSVAMDGATTKGVVDRLVARNLLRTDRDPDDRRRYIISLTPEGIDMLNAAIDRAKEVTRTTLSPLKPAERQTFLRLLKRIV
ncbi:MarR family winged helix-turn-helix transcriptional regulator [Marinibacterium sp. SX1]|uniref:MarR family winged helix-turn-helix transcriptional regulator n=1 Tax=Marinibacterium sp. SX1 TaxID=3388424 RepID=UPI003D172806